MSSCERPDLELQFRTIRLWAQLRSIVMVVDDDAAVRNSLQFSLDIEGYAVRVYPDANALLAATDLASCSCLIIDQRLPGLSGLELLAQLRGRGVAAPAILITTHPDGRLMRQAAEAGVAIVEKPLMDNALMERLRERLRSAVADARTLR